MTEFPIKVVRNTIIGLAVGVLSITCWPIRSVPTGSRGVITTGGSIRNIESEGFLLVAPWQKLSVFNIRAEAAQVDNAEGATSDTQPVHVTLTVRYSVLPDKVAEVFEKFSHNGDLASYVDTATRESFKAVTAKFTAPDLISKRQEVSNAIVETLRKKLTVYGAQVISVDVTSFLFSQSYMEAINAKVTQEQLRLVAENKLLTVESEQKQKVAIAEAEASATKARADGEAYAALAVAKAQAEALRVQNAALSQNKDVLELRRIEVDMTKAQKWNGTLPVNVYSGAPIPFLNVTK